MKRDSNFHINAKGVARACRVLPIIGAVGGGLYVTHLQYEPAPEFKYQQQSSQIFHHAATRAGKAVLQKSAEIPKTARFMRSDPNVAGGFMLILFTSHLDTQTQSTTGHKSMVCGVEADMHKKHGRLDPQTTYEAGIDCATSIEKVEQDFSNLLSTQIYYEGDSDWAAGGAGLNSAGISKINALRSYEDGLSSEVSIARRFASQFSTAVGEALRRPTR